MAGLPILFPPQCCQCPLSNILTTELSPKAAVFNLRVKVGSGSLEGPAISPGRLMQDVLQPQHRS